MEVPPMNSDPSMKPAPDLALVFTSLAVTLVSRPEGEEIWSTTGSADLSADDFPDQIGALKNHASVLMGEPGLPPPVLLALPPDHVLRMRLPLAADPAAQADMARAAVARRIGVPADSVLWALGPVEADGAVPMTAVLTETVEEAFEYAASWGFAPLGAAGPSADGGPLEPIVTPRSGAGVTGSIAGDDGAIRSHDDGPSGSDGYGGGAAKPESEAREQADAQTDAAVEPTITQAAALRDGGAAGLSTSGPGAGAFGPDRPISARRTGLRLIAAIGAAAAAAALAVWLATPRAGDGAVSISATVEPASVAEDVAAAEIRATEDVLQSRGEGAITSPAELLETPEIALADAVWPDEAEAAQTPPDWTPAATETPQALDEQVAQPTPDPSATTALALAMAPIDDPQPARAPLPTAPDAAPDPQPDAAVAPDASAPIEGPTVAAPAGSAAGADTAAPTPGPAADQPTQPPFAAEAPAEAPVEAPPVADALPAEPVPDAGAGTTDTAADAVVDAVTPPTTVAAMIPAPRPGVPEAAAEPATPADDEPAATAEPTEAAGSEAVTVQRAALLPAPRPQVVAAAAERRAQAPVTPRPTARPRNLATAAPVLQRDQAASGATRSTATAPREGTGDRPRSNAPRSVQQTATIRRGLPQGVALLGVFGGNDGRRALVRSESGALVRVRRGDRVDGWTISQVGADTVQMTSGGRTQTLRVAGR